MRRTVEAAVARGVVVGAHPSYPDREGFGRRPMDIAAGAGHRGRRCPRSARSTTVARACGTRVRFVKPHGALYHRMADDEACARAVCRGPARRRRLVLLAPAGSGAMTWRASWVERRHRGLRRPCLSGPTDGSPPAPTRGRCSPTPTRWPAARRSIAVDHQVRAVDGSVIALDGVVDLRPRRHPGRGRAGPARAPGARGRRGDARRLRVVTATVAVTTAARARCALRGRRPGGRGRNVVPTPTRLAAAVPGRRVGTASRTSWSGTARSRSWPTRRWPTSARMGEELARIPPAHPGPASARLVEIPVPSTAPTSSEVAGLAAHVPGRGDRAAGPVRPHGGLRRVPPRFRLPRGASATPWRRSPGGRRPAPRWRRGRWPSAGGSPVSTPGPPRGGGSSWGAPGSSSSTPTPRRSQRCGPGDTVRASGGGGRRCGADPAAAARCGRAPAHGGGRGTRPAVDGPGPRPCWAWPDWGCPGPGRPTSAPCAAANRLVGNADGAAALEVTALGPRLRFGVAVARGRGGRRRGERRRAARGGRHRRPGGAGQELTVGKTLDDLRCYIAVAGGLDIAPVLGSRSSDVLTGLGPGALRAGDVLGLGPPTRPRGRLLRRDTASAGPARSCGWSRGPTSSAPTPSDASPPPRGRWAPASDRMGVRLVGDEPLGTPTPGIASRGMVTGAVQVPPGRRSPWPCCATTPPWAATRWWPRWCAPISASSGSCRPGDAVRFEPVDLAEADAGPQPAPSGPSTRAVAGWFPVRSD